jgi:TIGR03009 family protein
MIPPHFVGIPSHPLRRETISMSARIAFLAVLCALSSSYSVIAQAPLAPGNPGVPAQPQPLAQAPFALNPQEEANLDRVLSDWQMMSGKVKTFEAEFTRWDYDAVFGNANEAARVAKGIIKYAAPDKGYYSHQQVDKTDHNKIDEANAKYNETWVCTGDAVFQFRYDLKQVREHKLPETMKGKAIADGPMPFVFGVEAKKMRERYWLRLTTTEEAAKKNQVWIEAFPKTAKDAANYYKVDVILQFEVQNGQLTKLEPFAIKLVQTNAKDYTVYLLGTQYVNTFLNNLGDFLGIFVRPATPLGWTHQVVQESELVGSEAPAGPASAQAPQPTVLQ